MNFHHPLLYMFALIQCKKILDVTRQFAKET